MKLELTTINGTDKEVGDLTKDTKFNKLLDAFLEAREHAKLAEELLSDAKKELAAYMTKKGLDYARSGDTRLAYTLETRASLDGRLLAQEQPDTYEAYLRETEYRKMTVAKV